MRQLLSLTLILIAFMAGAKTPCISLPDKASDADRAKWMQEMQQHQNDFIAKELELTDKQRADFMPLYNGMREDIMKASRASRAKAKAVRQKGEEATDADYDAATQAYLDFRTRESEIINGYYKKFRHILSKRQLYKLDSAERKFDRMLMQHSPARKRGAGAKAGGNRQGKDVR